MPVDRFLTAPPNTRASHSAGEAPDATGLLSLAFERGPMPRPPIPRHPVVRCADGTVEAWSITLVLADRHGGARAEPRSLARAAAHGRLFRVRPGVYAEPESWNRAYPVQRHLASAFAVAATRRTHPPLFCRETALLFHGLGFLTAPRAIGVRARSAGASGQRRPTASQGMELLPFREAHHLVPARWRRRSAATDASAPSTVWSVDEVVLAGVPVHVEPLAWAVADSIPRMEPVEAAVVLDALLSGRRTGVRERGASRAALAPAWDQDALQTVAGWCVSAAAADRFRTRAFFATAETESAGESASRVLIRDLGFELPELQHRVYDPRGSLIGVTDFWWARRNLVGEFDGLRKYLGRDSYSGLPAEQVVTAEKLREDAIRAQGHDMVRWVMADVRNPAALEETLRRHRVPYARG